MRSRIALLDAGPSRDGPALPGSAKRPGFHSPSASACERKQQEREAHQFERARRAPAVTAAPPSLIGRYAPTPGFAKATGVADADVAQHADHLLFRLRRTHVAVEQQWLGDLLAKDRGEHLTGQDHSVPLLSSRSLDRQRGGNINSSLISMFLDFYRPLIEAGMVSVDLGRDAAGLFAAADSASAAEYAAAKRP